jgi:hypothetical protein
VILIYLTSHFGCNCRALNTRWAMSRVALPKMEEMKVSCLLKSPIKCSFILQINWFCLLLLLYMMTNNPMILFFWISN